MMQDICCKVATGFVAVREKSHKSLKIQGCGKDAIVRMQQGGRTLCILTCPKINR